MSPQALAFKPDSTAGVHSKDGDVLALLVRYCSGEETPHKMFTGLCCGLRSTVNHELDVQSAVSFIEMFLPGRLKGQAGEPVHCIVLNWTRAEGATGVRELDVGREV